MSYLGYNGARSTGAYFTEQPPALPTSGLGAYFTQQAPVLPMQGLGDDLIIVSDEYAARQAVWSTMWFLAETIAAFGIGMAMAPSKESRAVWGAAAAVANIAAGVPGVGLVGALAVSVRKGSAQGV